MCWMLCLAGKPVLGPANTIAPVDDTGSEIMAMFRESPSLLRRPQQRGKICHAEAIAASVRGKDLKATWFALVCAGK